MAVSVEVIKTLREQTGAPIGDVKSALEACQGDPRKAAAYLKRKGFEAAGKRAGRATGKGRVESYIHHDGRLGAIIEVNCETDFVARLPEFQQLCRDLAMQVASQAPKVVRKDDLPAAERAEAAQACLLEQPFIKDASQTIGQYVSSLIAKTGENIVVRRFVRFGLGESAAA